MTPNASRIDKKVAVICLLLPAALTSQVRQFEVASVKRHIPSATIVPQSLEVDPNRLIFRNASLRACIQAAYGIPGEGRADYRLVGEPDWLASERFDIEAKAEHPVSKDEMMEMLQALLADRFKLKVHRESRELRVYELNIGKGGPRLASAKSDEPVALLQRTRTDPARGSLRELIVQRNSIGRFTEYLSRQFDVPVIDKTGLHGDFSFTIQWEPDANPPVSRIDVFGSNGMQTVQDQLGLKLEGTKSSVEVFVVDHMERAPTDN